MRCISASGTTTSCRTSLRCWQRLGAPIVQRQGGSEVRQVNDGDVLPFGHELVRVLATPGHTAACLRVAWRAPEAPWGRVKQRVFTLPDETQLFVSHERRARAVSTVLEQQLWQSRAGADVTLMECDSHEGFDDLDDVTQQMLIFLHPANRPHPRRTLYQPSENP
jgi:hypothetical protein